MRTMRARVIALAAASLLAGCGLLTAESPGAVVIGVDLNLSGRGNHLGTVFAGALRLEAERLHRTDLTLRVSDNYGDPQVAAQNLAAFAADPDVAGIITAGCPECLIDNEVTVPVISLDATEQVAAPAAERRWVFKVGPNPGDHADLLSLEMAGAGVRTVGVIATDDEYGQEGRQWLTDAAGRDALTVVLDQTLTTRGDRTAAVARTVEAAPEAVVLWLPAPLAAELATGLRQAGYPGRLLLGPLAVDEVFLTGPAAGFAGATTVFTSTMVSDTLIATTPAVAARQRWWNDYVARFGTYHVHSSWAGDALLVIADALDRAGGNHRARLREKLESTRIDGLTGLIRFTPDQHSGLHPSSLAVLTAAGDRWR
jgi:branched-chain amino acid transport system substrate-binding protein